MGCNDELVRLTNSLVINGDFTIETFSQIRYFARQQIVDELNKAGRKGQTISWFEGQYVVDVFSIFFEEPKHYQIIGSCYIPRSNINKELV